jgi:hypothetical protein
MFMHKAADQRRIPNHAMKARQIADWVLDGPELLGLPPTRISIYLLAFRFRTAGKDAWCHRDR